MEVREYEAEDLAEWLRMRRALWPDIAYADETADAAAWLATPGTVVLVAVRPGGPRLAGFAELGTREYADGCETSPVAYLEGVVRRTGREAHRGRRSSRSRRRGLGTTPWPSRARLRCAPRQHDFAPRARGTRVRGGRAGGTLPEVAGGLKARPTPVPLARW